MRIRIAWDSGAVEAVLEPTPSAQKIWEVLPCTTVASTWGEEVYFELPVCVEVEPDARQVVEEGTLCFWVEGRSLVLPYGPTPISQGDECRLIAPVNVLGQIEGDSRVLSAVQVGAPIRVERID